MAALNDILSGGETRRAPISDPVTGVDSGLPAEGSGNTAEPVKPEQPGSEQQTERAKPIRVDKAVDKAPAPAQVDVDNTELEINNAVKPRLSYAYMYNVVSPDKPETPEQTAAREKKEKREKIFAAIGDGISALSNLYFTTQYAPNAYDYRSSLSAKTRERFDKAKAERDANRRTYMEGYLRALDKDDAAAKDERNWRYRLKRDALEDKRAAAREKRDAAKDARDRKRFAWEESLQPAKQRKANAEAGKAETAEQYSEQYEQSRIDRNKAAAAASNRSGGSGKEKPSLRIGSKTNYYDTSDDYKRAVYGYAMEYGVSTTEEVVLQQDRRGNTLKRKTVNRPINEVAADVERKAAERENLESDDKVMPGVNKEQSSKRMPGVKA